MVAQGDDEARPSFWYVHETHTRQRGVWQAGKGQGSAAIRGTGRGTSKLLGVPRRGFAMIYEDAAQRGHTDNRVTRETVNIGQTMTSLPLAQHLWHEELGRAKVTLNILSPLLRTDLQSLDSIFFLGRKIYVLLCLLTYQRFGI